MDPGMSARKTRGILNASQREANAAIFRQLSGNRIPPFCYDFLCRQGVGGEDEIQQLRDLKHLLFVIDRLGYPVRIEN